MTPLKPALRNAAFAVAFVAILVAADLVSGVQPLDLPLPASATELRRYQQDVERAWQGGGGQVLFADDFSSYAAQWLDRQGAGLPGFRGGALPETGEGPTRWAADLYRWGHVATAVGSADGWDLGQDGYARFGNDTGYPLAVSSELVSPVIDLRGLPTLTQEAEERYSANPDPLNYHSSKCSNAEFPTNMQGCSVAQQAGNATTGTVVDENGHGTVASPVQDAAAALRVRHAYGFQTDQGRFSDGGRVVVAAYDAGTQSWGEWRAIEPTDRVLQLGTEQLRVRGGVPTPIGEVPVEARARQNATSPETLLTSTDAPAGVEAIVLDQRNVNSDDPSLVTMEGRNLKPHLYQGTIVASGDSAGSRWRGFGGASGGYVDSVFDLSRFAGHLVRVGFQAATSEGDAPAFPGLGWRLDLVEVHAAGAPTVQVVGLAQPGDGAAVPPGVDVRPSVILQNTGHDPVDVVLSLDAGAGRVGHQRARLSVGPLGRLHLATGLELASVDAGLVPLHASLQQVVEGTDAVATDLQRPDVQATFHFVAADAAGWSAGRPGFFPDGVARNAATKRVAINQGANVTLEVENTGTAPLLVRLGGTGAAAGSFDLRARLVDESGTEYGTIVPGADLQLPVSRAVAGTAGTPMAARTATWTWSGSSVARPLRLQVIDGAGHVLRDGGDVMVQTVAPNPLDIDFGNLWDFAAGDPACTSVTEWQGQEGVVQCPAGAGRVVSPVRRLYGIDLIRGNETSLLLSYRDGPFYARVEAVRSSTGAPDPLPPANAEWATLSNTTFARSNGAWKTVSVPGPLLPPKFVGHVRLVLSALDGKEVAFDEAGIYLKLRNSHGGEVSVPVVADRFDVTLQPARDAVYPTQLSGLVILDGIDNSTKPVVAAANTAEGVVRSTTTLGSPPVGETRFVEDSVLTLNDALDLAGMGRPTLSFRHWLDTGFYGTATVEVAPAGALRTLAPAATDAGSGAVGGWTVVARFNGTDTGRNTLPATISLWQYAGQSIFLRFRFHIDPAILTAEADGVGVSTQYPNPLTGDVGDQLTGHRDLRLRRTEDARPAGWLIEGVNVTAWDGDGPKVVHAATAGFPNYSVQGGHAVAGSDGYAVSTKTNCWSANGMLNPSCSTPRGISSLLSETMRLDTMAQPVLSITHSGSLAQTRCPSGVVFPAVDIEYQRMDDGSPVGPWTAGTPTEEFTWPTSGGNVFGWRRVQAAPWLPTLSGSAHGPPFAGTHELRDADGELAQNGCKNGTQSLVPNGYSFATREDTFDLSTIPAGAGNRIRLDVWNEKGTPPGFSHLVGDPPIGPYNVSAIRVSDNKQFIDARVDAITTDLDDRARLLAMDPSVAKRFGITDQVVLSNDASTFVVHVANLGQAAIDTDVSLSAVAVDGKANITVNWLEDRGGTLVPAHPPSPTGSIHLARGSGEPTTADVIFEADFSNAPPGLYRLVARVDATTGVDTAPANDVLEQEVLVLPFRRIELLADQSGVEPFAAEATAHRDIHFTVSNQGNVDETNVTLRADVVRMTGLTSFVPVDPLHNVTAHPLDGRFADLARRGKGTASFRWTLGPEDLPLGANLNTLFPPGQKYAIRVRADPAPGSVKGWWEGRTGPLPERSDGTTLLNLTRMPGQDCSCLLIPFLVERLLYGTDFTPKNSTSVLPEVLPIDTVDKLLAGWTATTLVDGEPLAPGERPDIPRWANVPAGQAAATFPGAPTGKAWLLPSYHGLERIDQVLESPALPAHVVKGASRSVLAMTYASGVPQGQATLETRSLIGGQWSAWRPIDAMRSQRVAIVLAYDFPRVNPTGLGAGKVTAGDFALSGPSAGAFATDLVGSPVRDGGASWFCYVDSATNPGGFDAGEAVYLASSCSDVRVGDLRLASPPGGFTTGTQVAANQTDVGAPLQGLGHAIGTAGGQWFADLNQDGKRGPGDLILTGTGHGTLLPGTTEAAGMTPGTLRRGYVDADGNGAYGPGDPVVVHNPALTAATQYDGPTLRAAGQAPPSWYGDPPLFPDHVTPKHAMGAADNAPACNWNADPTDAIPDGYLGRLCNWAPPLQFEAAGNEAWVDALDTLLRTLSAPGNPGADSVALFSTVGKPNSELAIGHWEGNTLVHTLRDGANELRFPIRDLDALGVDLDHYGAILLMGDGATKAYAATSSARLGTLWHGPGDTPDPAWLPPAERALAKLHHDRLFAILNAASAAGIGVVGALGPASATLALSGAVPNAKMAVWQTYPAMPKDVLDQRTLALNVYCTGRKPSASLPNYEAPAAGAAHPLASCNKSDGKTIGGVPDLADAHNYHLVSPPDAQSVFLREVVDRNGRAVTSNGTQSSLLGTTDCTPMHPFVAAVAAISVGSCDIFKPVVSAQVGDLTVLTAARPEDVGAWASQLLGLLSNAKGELPPGGWQPLPPTLAFPFGGRFLRRADGAEEFDGALTQVRVVVHGDETTQGHGPFALNRIGVLGTNRTQGLGIAFTAPVDGRSYAPGSAIAIKVQVTNRGLLPTLPTTATVGMDRFDPNGCPVTPWEPVTVVVPALAAGAQATLAAPINDGVLPDGRTCAPPAQQNVDFTLNATLAPGRLDDDARDDSHTIHIRGTEVATLDAATVVAYRVTPQRAQYAPDLPIEVAATLRNQASNAQNFRMEVAVQDARPLVCERHTPGSEQDDNLFACAARDVVANPAQRVTSLSLASDATGTLRVQATPKELGLTDPGVYRIGFRFHVTDSAGKLLSYPPDGAMPLQRILRLTPAADPAAARAALPPDGAFGFESNDLDATYAARPLQGARPFLVSNEGGFPGSVTTFTNNGLYGEDQTTTDHSDPNMRSIQHGWQVRGCTPGVDSACGSDSTHSYLEWRREGTPSYRVGTDPARWDQPQGQPDQCNTVDDCGYGDFGPDTLTWMPEDVADHRNDPSLRVPYLSLASYEEPMLTFLTKFDATAHTGYVIEMQVAQRIPCTPNGSQTNPIPGSNCAGAGWKWPLASSTAGFPLTTLEAQAPPNPGSYTVTSGDPEAAAEGILHPGGGRNSGLAPPYWERKVPSNPLAGKVGFWGQTSGVHSEDNWMRVHVVLNETLQRGMTGYCTMAALAAGEKLRADRDPCLYAQASDGDSDNDPNTYVARPVRFRFRAASFGGDAGESSWQIADLSLTDSRLRFLGPPQISVSMNDDDIRVVPVRVANLGHLPDRVDVAWSPTRAHAPALGRNGSIEVATMPDMRDAAPHLVLDLAAGQSRVVWVRIHTGIIDRAVPGAPHPIPFLVQARSLLDPAVVEEVLIDATFTSHAWPDLLATRLVLGDSVQQAIFNGSVDSPIEATLEFRNMGELPVGASSGAPLHAVLRAQRIDEATGLPVGPAELVDEAVVAGPILPYREDRTDHFVKFAAWTPRTLGLFVLMAELNAPTAGNVLPESNRANNGLERAVAVGPVRIANPQVTDLWAVEFNGKCGQEPAPRLVAGHAYCLAARVQNAGKRSALDPTVTFGVIIGGAESDFSTGAPSLQTLLGGAGASFPPATDDAVPALIVYSSPRAMVAPPPSAPIIQIVARADTRSFKLPDNALRACSPAAPARNCATDLAVDVFHLDAAFNATSVDLAPGRELRIPIRLGNGGNAPATAGIALSGDPDHPVDLAVRLEGVRTLLPHENATVTLVLAAGRQLDARTPLGALTLTVAEDPRAAIPLGLQLHVADGSLPEAKALLLRTAPGSTNATLVLDAAGSPVPYAWHAESGSGPLRVAPGWNATTAPFGREVVALPLALAPTAAPGTLTAPLRLVAEHDGVNVLVPLNVTLEVASRPALSARLVLDHRTAAPGAQAAFALQLNNTGNVALSPRIAHRVDLGAVTPAEQAATLPPGQGALLPFTALAGPFERALGQTEVAWSTAGGRSGNVTLPWRLDVAAARFEIAGSLPDLHPAEGQTSQVQVPVSNAGSAPAEAEVLLALDGVLQSRRTVTLDAGEMRQVALPFKAGPSGARQDLEVLVRPVGSDAWLGDAALYDAGDVGQAKVEPVADHALPIPALDGLLVLVACLGLAAAARRRRA